MAKHTYQKIYTSEMDYYILQTHTNLKKPRKVDKVQPDYMKALDAGEVVTVPYVAPPPPPDPSLAQLKETKIRDILNRTSEILQKGFTYDGKVFSLSQSDLGDWAWLAIYDSLSKLTFPRGVSTKDFGEYIIPNKAAFNAWCDTGIATALAIKDGERALRVAVLAATTAEEVQAVVDNR